MFRHFSPGTQIMSLITAGVMSLFGRRRRKTPAPPADYQPYMTEIQRVVNAHKDCTAEVFNVFVSGPGKVAISDRLTPDDRVDLKLDDDRIAVLAENTVLATTYLPDSSHLPEVFRQDADFDAYLGGRDVSNVSDSADFLSIIVFYKLPGVPPTHVNLQ